MFEEKDLKQEKLDKLDFKVWKRIFKIMLTDKRTITKLVLFVIFMGFLDSLNPLINKYAMDNFFITHPDFSHLNIFVIIYVLTIIAMFFSVSGFIKQASRLEESITYTIRKQAFVQLQKLSFSYYDVNSSGWILARVTQDTKKLSNIVSWGIVDVLWSIIFMLSVLIACFFVNPKLSLILMCLFPIFLLVGILFRKHILVKYRSVRKLNSAVTAALNEGFKGANTTKTLVLEENNLKDFDDLTEKYYKKSLSAAIFTSFFWPTIMTLGFIGVAVVAIVGSNDVLKIEDPDQILLAASSLYLFISYATKFFQPIMNISRVLADFQQAQASAERVLSLIETVPDILDTESVKEKYGDFDHPKTENFEDIVGDIEFKDVSFKYNGTEKLVLENFNLKINAGETVAFVGETGSGKSTIVNLICRFYEPSKGKILIDNVDYKERSIDWLHSKIGYVLQTPQLFDGSIKENVRYGKLDATDEEIKKACEFVNADAFISKLPEKYDTELGEGGNKVSVGEKQLISFARAIVKNPSLLVLDEATSSIDTETEVMINEVMHKVMKNRTCLIIAHRLSTVIDADKIVVLKNGKIQEIGNHLELLNKRGYYFELYSKQFLQEEDE